MQIILTVLEKKDMVLFLGICFIYLFIYLFKMA